MAKEKWICSCGTENTGKFCSSCGKTMDGATAATVPNDALQQAMQLQLQLKQQEMAMEEERRKQQSEHEKVCKEYDEACAKVPLNTLKKLGRSWIVLVLAILSSVTTAFTLVSAITGFSQGFIKIISGLISLLLAALLCAGFWKTWVECRKEDNRFNTSGIKLLRGVLNFNKVIMYLTMIGILILTITILSLISSVANDVTGAAGQITGEDYSNINMSINGILIMVLVIVVIVFAVQILYYSAITKFANETIYCLENRCAPTRKVTLAAIFFFIIGGVTLIGAIGGLVVTSAANEVLGSIASGLPSDMGNISSSLNSVFTIDIFATISNFANIATYILAGILAIKFNKLNDEIDVELQSIPKPEFN